MLIGPPAGLVMGSADTNGVTIRRLLPVKRFNSSSTPECPSVHASSGLIGPNTRQFVTLKARYDKHSFPMIVSSILFAQIGIRFADFAD